MSVILVRESVTEEDLKKASEDYLDYVKVVIDIENEKMAIGGEWHADAEKILLENGSRQDNIWGGGIDLKNKKVETIALINIRPRLRNDSQEILDQKIKGKFVEILKRKFRYDR